MTVTYGEMVTLLARPDEGWGHQWAGGGGWMALWWPLIVLFWVAVIAAVVWLLVRRSGPSGSAGVDRAKDVLAERFARGQIGEEEYEERLSVLRRRQS